MLDRVITLIRAGESGSGDDPLTRAIEAMRTSNCPDEWKTFAGYSSVSAGIEVLGVEPCSELEPFDISREAIALLAEDGYCSGGASGPSDPAMTGPQGAISWDEAGQHVGSSKYVCGPLRNTGRSKDDIFLNLGKPYPDAGRFTIVLWDVGGIESISVGRTLCARGRISSYEGVTQLELRNTSDVEIWE